MLTAHQLQMTDGQYVYVVAHQVPPQNVNTPWVAGDDQDEKARVVFESVIQVGRPTCCSMFDLNKRTR